MMACIFRLEDGSLWVHSPVALDEDMRGALEDLGGEVKYIMSPNYEHVKFAQEWFDAFPKAAAYGCVLLSLQGYCRPSVAWNTI